jgi:glycosyltransferase involved in cell wall biosynthesis
MRIVFVYSCLPLGGIETFFVRIIKQLQAKNISVSVLFFSHKFDENLLQELQQFATVYHWDDYVYMPKYFKNIFPIFKLLFPLRINKIKKDLLTSTTHFHAPDTYSMLFSFRLLNDNMEVPVTTGVYHINEYNIKRFQNHSFGKKLVRILQKIPFQNILFFNEISQEFYNSVYDKKFQASIVAPIGVDLTKYEGQFSGNQNNKIVSIGRLTTWKTYNFQMIEIIKEMNNRGIFLRYESYGDGEERENLENLVKKDNLQNQIFFHNSIPYHLLKDTISNSLMFIGAGTALIEASASGIPALIGIENESKTISYGFLHDTKSYSYQEKGSNETTDNIENYIIKLLNQTPTEYNNECQMARNRASDFSIETSTTLFLKMLNDSKFWKVKLSWLNSLEFIISLNIHLFYSKLKGVYLSSFFRRL